MTAKAEDGRLDIVPMPPPEEASGERAPEIVVGERFHGPAPEPTASDMLREAVSGVPVAVAPEAPPATPAEVVPVDQRYEPIPEPEVEQAAAAPARARPAREKKSWREQRWERRRRRIWFEETLAWFLVPVILVAGYFFVTGVLSALGTSLPAILNGLGAITSNL